MERRQAVGGRLRRREASSHDHVVAFRLNSTEPGTTRYNAFDFRYQDGARDAKAFLISGKGRIYVVTTGDNPGIYRAPATPSRQSMNTLVRVTDAPEGVTDGVFLSDGFTMALRTAKGIEYVDAYTWETTVTETIEGAPRASRSRAARPARSSSAGTQASGRRRSPRRGHDHHRVAHAGAEPDPDRDRAGDIAGQRLAVRARRPRRVRPPTPEPRRVPTPPALRAAERTSRSRSPGALALAAGAVTYFVKK